jgi:hypothetical protein
MQELRALEPYQLPWYGMNLSVGLSVSVAGFGMQVASGLLGELPFGAISMVGAKRCAVPCILVLRCAVTLCVCGFVLMQCGVLY